MYSNFHGKILQLEINNADINLEKLSYYATSHILHLHSGLNGYSIKKLSIKKQGSS